MRDLVDDRRRTGGTRADALAERTMYLDTKCNLDGNVGEPKDEKEHAGRYL